jgi:hypothetical protein
MCVRGVSSAFASGPPAIRIFGCVGVTYGTFCLSLLIPKLFYCFEDLGAEGGRGVHHALPFDLEGISRQVRFLQLVRSFMYESHAMFVMSRVLQRW